MSPYHKVQHPYTLKLQTPSIKQGPESTHNYPPYYDIQQHLYLIHPNTPQFMTLAPIMLNLHGSYTPITLPPLTQSTCSYLHWLPALIFSSLSVSLSHAHILKFSANKPQSSTPAHPHHTPFTSSLIAKCIHNLLHHSAPFVSDSSTFNSCYAINLYSPHSRSLLLLP